MVALAFGATIFMISCTNQRSQHSRNTLFDWVTDDSNVNDIPLLENHSIAIDLSGADLNQSIALSELLAGVKLVQLDESPHFLIGDIDKIIFNDSLIYMLDRYVHNSLQVFGRKGEFIKAITPTGNGPNELQSISDFDVDADGVYIYDNWGAKFHHYSHQWSLIEEWKVPLRVSTFRKIGDKKWLFSNIDNPNGHFLSLDDGDIVVWDQGGEHFLKFSSPLFNHHATDFTPRDVTRNNSGIITAMLRFHPEIYRWDNETNSFETLITIDLGNKGLTAKEYQSIGPSFIEERKKDQKFYSFGRHFVTEKWIGVEFSRSKGNPLFIFHDRLTGRTLHGTAIKFDVPGLLSFSLPWSCQGNTCIAHIELPRIKKSDVESYIALLKEKKLHSDELERLIRTVDDIETPILAIMTLQ
ncbi:hypothetical protein GCM10008106_18850 [Mongoliitalea lutea]|uniref:6-bladed beta-propeller protein n=2 Tax=Mongoliitalea lutea TaxID=849756 RepID=A0A8J3CYH8_9BACT|nr:hypothetical protein GCM10008106_18850 [Mongoliitalea lutea]